MTISPDESYKRHCLVLQTLEIGTHITWTRRRIGRVIHFILDKHHEIDIQYNDWRLLAFGWYSRTMQSDINTLYRNGLLLLDWQPDGSQVVSLTDSGRYHISRTATQAFGNVTSRLLQNLVPQLIHQSANLTKWDFVGRRIFLTTNPQRQVGELGEQDVIEDGEFGVGYIVVNGDWVPTEIVRVLPETVEILVGL